MNTAQLERAKDIYLKKIFPGPIEGHDLIFDSLIEAACQPIPDPEGNRAIGIHLLRLVESYREGAIDGPGIIDRLTTTAGVLMGKKKETVVVDVPEPDEFDELVKADKGLCPPG